MKKLLLINLFVFLPALSYSITYTAVPIAESAIPWKLNNYREVVGQKYVNSEETEKAFYWNNGEITILETEGGYAIANGINDNGVVIGYSTTDQALQTHLAFVWENGKTTSINPVGMYTRNYTYSINSNDVVVGMMKDYQDRVQGFKYENGAITLLPLWTARGITDDGRIVGGYEEYRTFVTLHPDGTMTGRVTGIWSIADINSQGWFVGDSEQRAFIWRGSGEIVILAEANSMALGLNDEGQVVGLYDSSGMGFDGRAVIWDKDGVMEYLDRMVEDCPDCWFGRAGDINNYGEIVVAGYVPGHTESSFLLLPTLENPSEPTAPEPEPIEPVEPDPVVKEEIEQFIEENQEEETPPPVIIPVETSTPSVPSTSTPAAASDAPSGGGGGGGCFIESSWW